MYVLDSFHCAVSVFPAMCIKEKKGDKRKKFKTSDKNLTTAEYTALNESVRILEGTGDPLEDLKRDGADAEIRGRDRQTN